MKIPVDTLRERVAALHRAAGLRDDHAARRR